MKIIDRIQQHIDDKKPFYALEFFPPKNPEAWTSLFTAVDKLKGMSPLYASVTYGAGGTNQHNTLELVSLLKNEHGMNAMPHLTCVGSTKDKIRAFLRDLEAADIHNVLALRGDPPKTDAGGKPITGPYDWSSGEFHHASELVAFIKQEFPHIGLAVAGYPYPHPESPTIKEDRKFTALKLAAGGDFMITQLFFDAREYLDLVDYMHAIGLSKPVIPGIMPIVSLDSIRHVLSMCGASLPARIYMKLEQADKDGGAEAVREAGVDITVAQIKRLLDMGAPGIHLYSLNQADLCLRIAEKVGM